MCAHVRAGLGRRIARASALVALLGGIALGPGCSKSTPPAAKESVVLARVGDTEIRLEDFNAEVARLRQAHRPVPAKQELLDRMIARAALLQRARAIGLEQDPAIRRELDSLLIGKLLDRELLPRQKAVAVSDEELKAEYERRRDQYTRAAKVRLAVLHLKVEKSASPAKRAEVRRRLEEARAKVIAHPPTGGRGPAAGGFGALAIDYSDDQASRYRGGDIGWLEPGNFAYRWPQPVLEAGYGLASGKFSPVIEAEDGFYLVAQTDSRPGAVIPFEQVRANLRRELLVHKRRELEETFQAEALRLVHARIDRQALQAVDVPVAPAAVAQSQTPLPAVPAATPPTNGQ